MRKTVRSLFVTMSLCFVCVGFAIAQPELPKNIVSCLKANGYEDDYLEGIVRFAGRAYQAYKSEDASARKDVSDVVFVRRKVLHTSTDGEGLQPAGEVELLITPMSIDTLVMEIETSEHNAKHSFKASGKTFRDFSEVGVMGQYYAKSLSDDGLNCSVLQDDIDAIHDNLKVKRVRMYCIPRIE